MALFLLSMQKVFMALCPALYMTTPKLKPIFPNSLQALRRFRFKQTMTSSGNHRVSLLLAKWCECPVLKDRVLLPPNSSLLSFLAMFVAMEILTQRGR